MIASQFILDLFEELLLDSFAGGGGASTGIWMALNRHVDHAWNHAWDALGMHRINHPQTVHHCEDVFDVVPSAITEGRPVGLAWFSPDCKHFSKAKGGKPLSKKIRGLAFVIFRWAKIGVRVIPMENVEEIKTWGPLLDDGRPDPKHKGRTWQAFLDALCGGVDPDHPDLPEMLDVLGDTVTREELIRGFGYVAETRELRACDYGTPTIRKRLFMIARCDGKPIVWPKPTHAAPDVAKSLGLKPWRAVAECIDWHLPCHSIFLTPVEAKKARCRRPLAASTLRRIAKGVDRYVLKAKKPFLVSLTHQGGDRVESVDEPAKVITGAHRGEKAVVDAAVTPFISEHANASTQRNFSAEDPLRTQCAEVKGGHFSVVSPVVVNSANSKTTGRGPNVWPVEEPLRTVTSSPSYSMISAGLARTAHGEQDKNGKKRGKGQHSVEEPSPTIVASGDLGLFSAHLCRDFGESIGQPVTEPAPTVMPDGQGKSKLISASMVKFRGDPESHPPCKPADAPSDTISANGLHHGLSVAYLAQHNAGNATNPGHAATEPASTISSKGAQQQVVMGNLCAYYGSEAEGQGIDEPARTATTKARFGLSKAEAYAPPMTEEQISGAHRVAAFLRAYGVEFEGEFATVEGFVIVDIGMRMLTPRELFRAQGFPEDYVIDRAWVVDPQTGEIKEITLTKEQQIRMCGNSVCPPVVKALIEANVPELIVSGGRRNCSPVMA